MIELGGNRPKPFPWPRGIVPMQLLSIGKKQRIYTVAFSPDGRDLAAVCGDLLLRIWDLETGEVRRSVPFPHASSGYDAAYIDAGRMVFSGIDLNWWDIEPNGWNLISAGAPWGRRLRVSPDGKYLVEVDQVRSTEWVTGPGVIVRDTATWEPLLPMEAAETTTGGAAFSPDGRFLATGHMQHVGRRRRSIGFPPDLGLARVEFQVNDYDYLVHLREFPSGQVVRTLGGWQQPVTELAFSPGGTVLAGTAGPRLRVWDVAADRELALHKRGTKHFKGLAFGAGGQFLATVSNDETVRIWDARAWEEYRTYTWQIGKLLNIAFAPDGLRAAAGSDKGQIVIWDVD